MAVGPQKLLARRCSSEHPTKPARAVLSSGALRRSRCRTRVRRPPKVSWRLESCVRSHLSSYDHECQHKLCKPYANCDAASLTVDMPSRKKRVHAFVWTCSPSCRFVGPLMIWALILASAACQGVRNSANQQMILRTCEAVGIQDAWEFELRLKQYLLDRWTCWVTDRW